MREIKFRGKVTGKPSFWVHGDLLSVIDKYYIINYDFEKHHDPNDCELWSIATEVIPETVGQFTGLKDKNGNDVYEGDIVNLWHESYPNEYNEITSYVSTGNVIFMPSKGYCIKFTERVNIDDDKKEKITSKYSSYITQSRIKVIGNIHDNEK